MTEPLLLDTHVWYWFVEEKRRRMARFIPRKIESAVRNGRVFVSAISVWELGVLLSKRRLVLATSLADWVVLMQEPPGVQIADVTTEIALEGGRLGTALLTDPADCLIVATARSLGAALVTCDRRVLDYAEDGDLRVVDARP